MHLLKRVSQTAIVTIIAIASVSAQAESQADFLAAFKAEAAAADKNFADFDASRGKSFFNTKHSDWSCSTCHTANPLDGGKHAVTDKAIEPLAPAANPERFTDAKKVAKWFKRNCKDVVKRECTAAEKGDVLTYLLSLKK